MPTGIDRVELAYLAHMHEQGVPLYGLVRTAFGYLLIDPKGMSALHARFAGAVPWGAVDHLSKLLRNRTDVQRRAEADARRVALARAMPPRLTALLRKHVPPKTRYFNIGHSNLTDRVFRALRASGLRVTVFIHDVIPLDYPQYQRSDTVEPFRQKLRRVWTNADEIIYNSADTRRRTEAQMGPRGVAPQAIVAHLGTTGLTPDLTELPAGLPPAGPYFITVGTIEPRKNHAFLLDLWARWGIAAPPLLICGSRGWNNEDVFFRLDGNGGNRNIREISGLTDNALAALVEGAAGALFPSHAEGFGLPVVEAAMLGTRVLCNDLTVFREIMGDRVVYAPVSQPELWINTLRTWQNTPPKAHQIARFVGPTWDEHFKTVLRLR